MLIFLLDYWLIAKRESSEKKQTAMTVGEVVNSIISLDKREYSLIDTYMHLTYIFSIYLQLCTNKMVQCGSKWWMQKAKQ
jgi:hypothetical protein